MEKKKNTVHYVLTEYVEKALDMACYDKLEDGSYAGRIDGFPGVVSFGKTLLSCQSELRSTLEDWVLVGLRLGHRLPKIHGIDLNDTGSVTRRARASRNAAKKAQRG